MKLLRCLSRVQCQCQLVIFIVWGMCSLNALVAVALQASARSFHNVIVWGNVSLVPRPSSPPNIMWEGKKRRKVKGEEGLGELIT